MSAIVSVTGSGRLSGSRRGLERHQTLRQAVAWSYDLLDDDERTVLQLCSVFAGGFDVAAAASAVCADGSTSTRCWTCWIRWSANRWSPSSRAGGRPLRVVGDDPPVRRGPVGRDRRDRRGPRSSRPLLRRPGRRHWECGTGPTSGSRSTGSRPSSPTCAPGSAGPPTGPTVTAAAIAAHATMMALTLSVYEPVGWAEETPRRRDRRRVRATAPPLHRGGSLPFTGRPEAAVRYAQAAVTLGGRGPLPAL